MSAVLAARAATWPERLAIVEPGGETSYQTLLDRSAAAAGRLLDGRADLHGTRVAFLVPPGADHVALQWAIWRSGGVAVPLSSAQATAEWEYVIRDAAAEIVVGARVDAPFSRVAAACGARYLAADRLTGSRPATSLPPVAPSRDAMILYTSGTTGRPKGVVVTHANIEAQIGSLVEAWGWVPDDRILHVLPLNHVHGIVNLLGCALWCGATCEFLSPFRPDPTWDRLASGDVTIFMAVPTIYAKLLAAWDESPPERRQAWSRGGGHLRLMVSGSAALPVTLSERWREATGHVLLERYGMTEFGMALSNPLCGERRPGSVGVPLPGMEVRLVDEQGTAVPEGEPGEIEVRGPAVFRGYWRRDEETRTAFRDGWFRTGDVAGVESGRYRILGRRSVDIIKTGGYKVSALEVEEVLRTCPAVGECAVVGVADPEWGERIAVAVEPRAGVSVTLDGVREWAAGRLARYKLPTRLVCVTQLPRNAMGKVTKTRVRELFT